MDGITAAVALMGEQAAIQRSEFAVRMVKDAKDADQGVIEMIMASADVGSMYSGGGGRVASTAAGAALNTTA